MLSSWFDSARRSIRRHTRDGSISSRINPHSRTSNIGGRSRIQSWYEYDRNVDEDDSDGGDITEGNEGAGDFDHDDEDAVDEELEDSPLLPIFEASYLDSLPVYALTHTLRLLISPRCETTLSWDQLRSPQVSQFLVKPIQKEILDNHFSKATVYALIANCLQFTKEADTNPAIVGMSKTRAMVCELVAIRILKEYSTRELIDVLSYDFYPLQGMEEPSDSIQAQKRPQAARTSTLEVAILASAKRFLAHPMVVRQLEAIWAGTIVFHHAADAAHRSPKQLPKLKQYGTIHSGTTSGLFSEGGRLPNTIDEAVDHLATRRTVTLYDPMEASLFKLSRLRVPRYRHFMSTCSLAVFLGLFLAVLTERSMEISTLEIVFWFWSAGFMLDEMVGFNEQGFSLYIMSFWNAFDIGILLLLICFYTLRLYSIVLLGGHKQHISGLAFDMLAANAVFLFPRLFSILDHYRYFSQLLIAFRMMAQDLAAVFVLIAISCSGFFVAFTLSFGNDINNPGGTAYALFQMLMGFSPTAWTLWDEYNVLGRTLLVLFLTITHFLIVTILVTVLTNSFTAIVQNANDEHQFVFAVNTISMVKSDALFSYLAPSNILGWLLTPLRYVMPFRQFVWLNRTVIKSTHLPVLLFIFAYERLVLRHTSYETVETIQERGRETKRLKSFDPISSGMMIFSPHEPKLREPSAATFHKDKALAEVFKRPFKDTTRKGEKERKKRAAVANWMQGMGPDGEASPPDEQDSDVVDSLERTRFGARGATSRRFASAMSIATRSLAASDPEDFGGNDNSISRLPFQQRLRKGLVAEDLPEQSDHYGDDELVSNDDATEQNTIDEQGSTEDKENEKTPKQVSFARPRPPLRSLTSENLVTNKSPVMQRHSSISFADTNPVRSTPSKKPHSSRPPTSRRSSDHKRNISVQTVLFNPAEEFGNDAQIDGMGQPPKKLGESGRTAHSRALSPPKMRLSKIDQRPFQSSKPMNAPTPPRPILSSRQKMFSTPHFNIDLASNKDAASLFSRSPPPSSALVSRYRGGELHASFPQRTSANIDLASDLGDNKASGGLNAAGVPASFATQYDFANRIRRMRSEERHDDDRRMNKLMLARMGVLEQGFREVLKEVREIKESERKKKKIRTGFATSRRGSKVHTTPAANESDGDPPLQTPETEWIDEEAREGEQRSSI